MKNSFINHIAHILSTAATKYMDQISQHMSRMQLSIETALSNFASVISSAATQLSDTIATVWQKMSAQISLILKFVLRHLQAAGYAASDVINRCTDALASIVSRSINWVSYNVKLVTVNAGQVVTLLYRSLFKPVLVNAQSLITTLYNWVLNTLSFLWQHLVKIASLVSSTIQSIISPVIMFFKDMLLWASQIIVKIISQGLDLLTRLVQNMMQACVHMAQLVQKVLITPLVHAAKQALQFVSYCLRTSYQALASLINHLTHFILKAIQDIGQVAKQLISTLSKALVSVMNKIGSSLEYIYTYAISPIISLGQKVLSHMAHLIHSAVLPLVKIASKAIQSISNGLMKFSKLLTLAASKVLSAIHVTYKTFSQLVGQFVLHIANMTKALVQHFAMITKPLLHALSAVNSFLIQALSTGLNHIVDGITLVARYTGQLMQSLALTMSQLASSLASLFTWDLAKTCAQHTATIILHPLIGLFYAASYDTVRSVFAPVALLSAFIGIVSMKTLDNLQSGNISHKPVRAQGFKIAAIAYTSCSVATLFALDAIEKASSVRPS